jgi:hypothetical protein
MSSKPPLSRNLPYISPNPNNFLSSNKPKLTRNQRYISPNSSNVSLSNNDNIVNNIIIEINGEKYGLYKLHTPTRRNGGKRHNKKRHTRKH